MVDPFATQVPEDKNSDTTSTGFESKLGFNPDDIFGGDPSVFAAMQPNAFQPIDPETGLPIDHTQETLDPFLRDSVEEQQSLEEDVAMATVGDVYEDAAQIPQEDPAQIPEEDSMDIHAVQDADVVSDVSPELTIEAPVDETPITSEEVVSDVMDSSYGDGMIENVQTSDEGIGEQEQYNPTEQSIDSSVADAVVDPIVEQDASTEYSEDPFVAGDVVSQDADYYDPFLADHADARFAVSSDGEDPFVSASVDEAIVPESEESSDVIDSIPDDAVDAIGEASDPSLDEPQVSSDDLPSSVDLDPVDDSLSEPENIAEIADAADDQPFEDTQEEAVDPFLRDDMDVEQTVDSEPSILTAAEEFSAQDVLPDETVSDGAIQSDILESSAELEPPSQESIDEVPLVDTQDTVPALDDAISPIGDGSIDENMDIDLESVYNTPEDAEVPVGDLQGLVDGFIDPFISSSSVVESTLDSVEDVDQDVSDEKIEEVPQSSDAIGEEEVPVSSLVVSDDLKEDAQEEVNDGDTLEPTVDEVVDDNTTIGNYSDLVQKFYALQQAIYHVYDYQNKDEDFTVIGADNDALSITYTFALSHDQQHIVVTKQQINRSDDSQTSHVLRFVLTKDITLEVFIDDVLLFTEAGLVDDIKGKMQVMDKFNKFTFLVNTYADSLAEQARLVQDTQQAKEHFQQF